MSVYISKQFSSPEEFEAWVVAQEHKNKGFLDNLCEKDKENWDKKACKMTVKDGKLQLLCEDGNVLAETNYYQPDGDTVCCEDENGKLRIKGIENTNDPNGKKFRVWVGTQAEYDAIRVKDPKTMYYITDETLLDDILSGAIKVGHAKKADHATKADHANGATIADNLVLFVPSTTKEFMEFLHNPNNQDKTFSFATNANGSGIALINNYGTDKEEQVCIIPTYARGTLTRSEDSALCLVDNKGNHFTAYYTPEQKVWTYKYAQSDKASTLESVNLASSADLERLVSSDNIGKSYAVSVGGGNNPSGVFITTKNGQIEIPSWARGILVNNGDSSLTMVDSGGRPFVAFYNYTGGLWDYKYDEVSNATKADSATKLANGATIGRRALFEQRGSSIYNYSYEIKNNNQQITIPNIDLKDKFIIFEITVFSGSLYGSGMIGRFRTTPIYETLYTDSYGMNFVIPCAVVKGHSGSDNFSENRMWFDIKDNNTITVSVENFLSGGETGERYFLSGIYEEI